MKIHNKGIKVARLHPSNKEKDFISECTYIYKPLESSNHEIIAEEVKAHFTGFQL